MIGETLATRYRIERELGRGGMATVYVAQDLRLSRQVAVKVMHPTLGEKERRRFGREAEIVASLKHPNIVEIHDLGETPGGLPFMVTELVEGENLRQLTARLCPMAPQAAAVLCAEVARALAAAHARGVVHRDVKPENVLVARGGPLKLADFGIAAAQDQARLTTTDGISGSLAYMAPERIDDGGFSPATDVYAVGVMLYELCAGKTPFEGKGAAHLAAAVLTKVAPRLSEAAPAVPEALSALVASCLAREPKERPADGAALGAALNEVVAAMAGPAADEARKLFADPEGYTAQAREASFGRLLAEGRRLFEAGEGAQAARVLDAALMLKPGASEVREVLAGRRKPAGRRWPWIASAAAVAVIAAAAWAISGGGAGSAGEAAAPGAATKQAGATVEAAAVAPSAATKQAGAAVEADAVTPSTATKQAGATVEAAAVTPSAATKQAGAAVEATGATRSATTGPQPGGGASTTAAADTASPRGEGAPAIGSSPAGSPTHVERATAPIGSSPRAAGSTAPVGSSPRAAGSTAPTGSSRAEGSTAPAGSSPRAEGSTAEATGLSSDPRIAGGSARRPARAAPVSAAAAASGTLRITTRPWAEVLVDGKSLGFTPRLKEVELSAGPHLLRLTNSLCEPVEETVRIEAGAALARDVQLTVRKAELEVDAPAGAELFVDGLRVGVAPLSAPLAVEHGQHVVTARLAGTDLTPRDVSAVAGQRRRVRLEAAQ